MATQMVSQASGSKLFCSSSYSGIALDNEVYSLQDLSKTDIAAPRLIMLANVALTGEISSSCCDYSLEEEREMAELTTVNDSFSDGEGEKIEDLPVMDIHTQNFVIMELETTEIKKNGVFDNQMTPASNMLDRDLISNPETPNIMEDKNKYLKSKPLRCKPCQYTAKSEEEFFHHIQLHSAKILFDNDTNKTLHANEMESSVPEDADTSKGPIQCDRCGYNTNRFDHYLAHLKHHNKAGENERVYKCTICTYTTVSEYHWKKHLRNHFPRILYTCSQCSYFSDRKNNYIQHIRTHTGERPYQCILCPYSSSQKTHLTRHMRTHSGEKPFKCEQCSYVASNQHEVTRHARQVHNGPKPLTCPHCDYKTADRSNFKKHVELHVNPRQFLCPVCDYAASKKCNLQYHIKSRHSGCTDITMDVSKVKLRTKKGEVSSVDSDDTKQTECENVQPVNETEREKPEKVILDEKKESCVKAKNQAANSRARHESKSCKFSSLRKKKDHKVRPDQKTEKCSKVKYGKRKADAISEKPFKPSDSLTDDQRVKDSRQSMSNKSNSKNVATELCVDIGNQYKIVSQLDNDTKTLVTEDRVQSANQKSLEVDAQDITAEKLDIRNANPLSTSVQNAVSNLLTSNNGMISQKMSSYLTFEKGLSIDLSNAKDKKAETFVFWDVLTDVSMENSTQSDISLERHAQSDLPMEKDMTADILVDVSLSTVKLKERDIINLQIERNVPTDLFVKKDLPIDLSMERSTQGNLSLQMFTPNSLMAETDTPRDLLIQGNSPKTLSVEMDKASIFSLEETNHSDVLGEGVGCCVLPVEEGTTCNLPTERVFPCDLPTEGDKPCSLPVEGGMPCGLPALGCMPCDLPVEGGTPCDLPVEGGTPCDLPVAGGTPCDLPVAGGTPCDLPVAGGTPCDLPVEGGTPCDLPVEGGTPCDLAAVAGTTCDLAAVAGTPCNLAAVAGTPCNLAAERLIPEDFDMETGSCSGQQVKKHKLKPVRGSKCASNITKEKFKVISKNGFCCENKLLTETAYSNKPQEVQNSHTEFNKLISEQGKDKVIETRNIFEDSNRQNLNSHDLKDFQDPSSSFNCTRIESVYIEEDEGIHSHDGSDISDNVSERSDDSGLNSVPFIKESYLSVGSFVCIFCDRAFKKEEEYTKHLKRHLVNVYYLEKAANES
ncbi:RE1-silencing transcription factor [Rhinophrynus dorsalis]